MNYDKVCDRLRRFEGVINYMYCCAGAEVTIGIGHAIFSPEDAGTLRWSTNSQTASKDWQTVANAFKEGAPASFYQNLTTSRMADADIDSLCDNDIAKYEKDLKKQLPKWNSYPENVQEALFDMGYNLGISGLMKFHNMLAAIDRCDGPGAAAECHRKGIQEERNTEIYSLFYVGWSGATKV